MKLKGKTLGEPEPAIVVFTRGQDEFVFQVKPVFNLETFDTLCPEPKPTHSMKDGLLLDDAYKQRLDVHLQRKTEWVIITALSATEDLEWEQVDLGKPDTWHHYEQELRSAGLTSGEITYLINAIHTVNNVDEKTMEEARERFIHSQGAMG